MGRTAYAGVIVPHDLLAAPGRLVFGQVEREFSVSVRRGKARIFRGFIPPGNWVAPAGSYRSGGGGNETAGAFETTDR